MYTGVLSPEVLSQVLRDISQKRRQGVLSVDFGNETMQVMFVTGRIAEVSRGGVNPVHAVVERLIDASMVSDEIRNFSGDWEESYSKLFVYVNDNYPESPIDESRFGQVVEHRILDEMYLLGGQRGAVYSFKVQMVPVDKTFCPMISTGQLLLDLVAIEEDSQRFAGLFKDETRVVRSEQHSDAFSKEERGLFEIIGEGITVSKLRKRSLLSLYHFQQTLLLMLDRGIIRIQDSTAVSAMKRSLLDNNVLQALDSSIDATFESEFGEALDDLDNGASGPPGVITENSEIANLVVDNVYRVPALRMKLGLLSARLISDPAVIHLVVLIFLICAAFLPFLVWSNTLSYF